MHDAVILHDERMLTIDFSNHGEDDIYDDDNNIDKNCCNSGSINKILKRK